MTRAAIEKVYRLTQNIQLLNKSNLITQTNLTKPITLITTTTISKICKTVSALAISGSILTNSTNINTNLRFNFNFNKKKN